MPSNTMSFAEHELDILVKSSTDPDNRPIIEPFIPEILALVDKFGNSGQSGGSAPYTAGALSEAVKKLCLQKPICEITGLEDEWNSCANMGDEGDLYQNSRCSALFKTGINGMAHYLDAVIWKTGKGMTWSGTAFLNGKKVWSRQYVKSFPFTPKTFFIDVIEKEVAKDDWEFTIKDESQLKEAFEYYNEYGS